MKKAVRNLLLFGLLSAPAWASDFVTDSLRPQSHFGRVDTLSDVALRNTRSAYNWRKLTVVQERKSGKAGKVIERRVIASKIRNPRRLPVGTKVLIPARLVKTEKVDVPAGSSLRSFCNQLFEGVENCVAMTNGLNRLGLKSEAGFSSPLAAPELFVPTEFSSISAQYRKTKQLEEENRKLSEEANRLRNENVRLNERLKRDWIIFAILGASLVTLGILLALRRRKDEEVTVVRETSRPDDERSPPGTLFSGGYRRTRGETVERPSGERATTVVQEEVSPVNGTTVSPSAATVAESPPPQTTAGPSVFTGPPPADEDLPDSTRRIAPPTKEGKLAQLRQALYRRSVTASIDDERWPIVEIRVPRDQEEKTREYLKGFRSWLVDGIPEARKFTDQDTTAAYSVFTVRFRES